MKTCATCDETFAERDGFFSANGLVCPSCHAAQAAKDSAAFEQGAEISDVHGPGLAATQVGNTTVTLTGPIGVVLGIVQWVFGLIRSARTA